MKTDRKTKVGSGLDGIKTQKPRRVSSKSSSKSNGKHALVSYEHVPIGIVESSPDGSYVNVNEEFCRITGYLRQELLTLGIKDVTHEEDRMFDINLHERLVAGKIPFYKIEKRIKRKDGSALWVELTRSVVRDPKGKALYTIGAVLDISDRKHVERVLHESVEQLRLATGAAQMFMWEWDFTNQSYIVADNFEQVVGFATGLLSRNSFDTLSKLIPLEDIQSMSEAYQQAIEQHRDLHSLTCRVIHPETSAVIWLEVSAKIIYERDGTPVRMFGVAQNVTESKKTQDEIAILSRMPGENPNPVVRLTPEGSILYANHPGQAILELWKQRGDQTIPAELQKQIEEAFASGVKKEIEITQNGKTFSCTLAPVLEARYINFYAQDISRRKQAEEKLRESEERFRALVSQATAGIAQSDVESRLTFVNPRFCEMLGYTEEELLGKTIWELTYTEDLEENKRMFQRMLTKGEPYQFEKRFMRRDRSTVWTNVSVTTIHDSSGKPKGGVGVIVDIEERKQAEETLIEFARQQEALYQLSDQLHRADSVEDVFDAALDAILRALRCDRASILLYDRQDVMRFVAWRGLSDEYRKATDGHSPWKPDAKDPQPIRMDDIRTADLDEALRVVIQKEGICALAFIPLVVNEQLIGKFMIYYDTPHTFEEAELDLSLTIAHQLAFGVDRQHTEEALTHERETLERLFETMPVMVSMVDPETNSIRLNAEFQRRIGWKSEEVTSNSLWESLYPDAAYRNDVLQRMAAAGRNEWVEAQVQTRSGRTLDSLWSNISLLKDQNLGPGIALGLDITERKQAENRLALLAEISEMLRNFDDPYELMYRISKSVGEHLQVKRVLFNEINLDQDREIVHRDYHSGLSSVAGIHRVSDYSSITSRQVAAGKTVVNVDSKTDPRTAQDYERTYALSGERSYVVVPMIRDNHWVASLWVSDNVPRHWSPEEVSLLETVAERTWTVIEKLRINTALRESEQRFREIFETAGVSVWVEDFSEVKQKIEELYDQGVQDLRTYFAEYPEFVQRAVGLVRVLDVNTETLDLFRARDKEALLGSLSKVFAPETEQIFVEELLALAEGREMLRAETKIQTLEGKPISVLFTVHFAPPTGDQSRVVVTLTDITDRKRMEESLRNENERFMRFVDSNVVGILIGNASGEVILANDYYLRLLGVEREDLRQQKVDWKKFTPPEWIPADEKAIQELHKHGVCEPYEKEYIRTDGTRVPVYIADAMLPGSGEEIAAFVVDISERKRAEDALRTSEERYRGIVNQTIAGIAETDLTGAFITVNDRYCEITGYTREKLLSELRMQDVTHPNDLQKNLELFGHLATNGNSFEIEKRYVRPDGSVVWVHNSVSAITGADGKPQSAVAVVIDVTERKQAEEQLRRSAEFDAFRVALMDALRPLSNPQKILSEAMHVLGEKLQVDRVLYSEIQDDDETILILDNYVKDGVPKLTGRALLSDYGKARGSLSRGKNLIITDATISPEMDEKDRASFAALGIRSGLGIPLIKGGRWIGTLGVHHGTVRTWTENEIKFMEETAERTWTALERARAQEKLHATETLYRAIARNIPGGGVYVVDKDFRYLVSEGPVTQAFGLTREILEGHTVAEVFPDERGKTMEDRLRKNFAGETVSFETQHNGRVYWTQQAPLHESIGEAIILTLDITERKQAEEALRQSEERFARFMHHLPGLAWIKDIQGRYVYANAAAEQAFNTPRENLYGRTDEDIFPPNVAAQFRRNDEQALADEKGVQVIETLEHADGVHHSLVSKFPIPGPDGTTTLIGGTAFDITERLRAEEALRESEERFRAILRQATAGIVRKDAKGHLIFVNEAFCNMLGYTEAELLGKTVWDFMHEDDIAENKRSYERLMMEGIPFKLERRLIREDRSIIWVDASVSPIRDAEDKPQSAVAVEVDITGRKQAEEALQQLNLQLEERVLSRTAKLRAVNQTLREEIAERKKAEDALRKSEAAARENEEKLSTLFELLPVGISFLDTQGQIIQMNSALANMLKLSKDQVSDQIYKSRTYIRANGTLMSPTEFASRRALEEGKTVYNVETGVVMENNEVVWTSVSAAPVAVADVGTVVVTADITESKRAERALQESRERLQILSQRLVEVQEDERRAIARELHDRVGQTLAALNINLIIISGQLGSEVDEQISTRLNDSMKLVAETISLVRDVMSNLRPSVLDDYGLEAAIEAYLSQFMSRYEITTKFEKPHPPIPRLGPSIEMTFLRIAQESLMNIARHAQASQVTLSLWQAENAVWMTVQDNGLGIVSWQNANRPGSHGLTIMRERAEAFGGDLQVSSVPGEGTRVEVRIPVESNEPPQAEKELHP